LNPEDDQAYQSLGIICAQTQRPDEARKHFVNALRLNPEDALAAQYLQRLNAQGR
jgi:Flp pilus assembly protein TadD